MTKSRKVGIILACALVLALLAVSILPLMGIDNTNTASAVTVTPRDEWTNSYTGSYYDNLNVSTGSAFRSELAGLITRTHTHETSYDELKTVFKTTDADPNKSGNVIWYYTGESVPYTGAMDSGNYPTNREHVWPKMGGAAFPEKSQAGSDAHHLRPLNTGLNNTRSNYHFGEVTQSTGNRVSQSGTNSSYGTNDPDTWCYLSGGNFYPAKGYRGATARILFYVQTRWGDTSNLSFTLGSGSTKVMSNVDTLLKWHLEEPPTDEEIRRNEAVFKIQGNRNPFIDHPEYAELIYCNDGNSYNNTLKNVVSQCGSYLNGNVDPTPTPDKTPTSISLSPSSISLEVGKTSQQITVTATPSTASNDVTWSTSDSKVATVSSSGVVTAVSKGTATITATSVYSSSVKATLSVTVNPVQLERIQLQGALRLNTGAGWQFTATPVPSNASAEVTWSSSDTSVATVDKDGYVVAVSPGAAIIKATSVEFPNISSSITVNVNEAPVPTKIEVTGKPNKTDYTAGETFDPTGLTVTVTYSDNSTDQFAKTDELLENFKWLDGVTGNATLSLGTTTVICQYGDKQAAVSGISVVNNIDAFLNKMAKVEADNFEKLPLKEQFEALKDAVSAYNKLSASEKTDSRVVGKYSTLRAAVQAYNDVASAENVELQQAVTLSVGAIVKTISSAVAALIVAVVKGLLGR